MQQLQGIEVLDPAKRGYFYSTYEAMRSFSLAEARHFARDIKTRILKSAIGDRSLEETLDTYLKEDPSIIHFVLDSGKVYAVRNGDQFAVHAAIIDEAKATNRLIFSYRRQPLDDQEPMKSFLQK